MKILWTCEYLFNSRSDYLLELKVVNFCMETDNSYKMVT